MPYYKAQHEVFVRALIRHGDQLLAYRQAYPKANKESAYTAAIRLLRRPQIRERVQAALEQHAWKEREREREREERKRMTAEEDILRRRIWLAKVVRGEVEQKRYFQVRGRSVLVYDSLSTNITLAAIELDTKYEYGYSPKVILDRQFDRLYARATRVVGLNKLIELNGLIRLNGQMGNRVNGLTPNGVISSISTNLRFRQEKNTQITSKKLTDSKQNPRRSTVSAINKNDICNKAGGRKKVKGKMVKVEKSQTTPANYTMTIPEPALATQALIKIAERSGRIENSQ